VKEVETWIYGRGQEGLIMVITEFIHNASGTINGFGHTCFRIACDSGL
jgi:hypothetical protein